MRERVLLRCHNPEGVFHIPRPTKPNPRVKSLSARTIGLFWDGKKGGDNFFIVLEELLKERYTGASVVRVAWNDIETANKVKQEVDTFVYGVGDNGYGGWSGAYQVISLERMGKPGVLVITDNCIQTARLSAEMNGMPTIRIIDISSIDYFSNRINVEKIRPIVETYINQIIDALTKPLTVEEENPKLSLSLETRMRRSMQNFVEVNGDDYESAFNNFNQLCVENRWADGLPLTPPTERAVKNMLTGTTRSPDEVIGKLPFMNGTVTVKKIAINAVMAGARPEHLPIIITALECIIEDWAFAHMLSSEGSFTLMILVSGPIARKINLNSEIALLGSCNHANNTIGRAIRLCLMNIGHIKPGEFDMALIGRPSPHTFYVFAENEDKSPWEPYHVSLGYKPEDNCVTVSTVGRDIKIYGGGVVEPWDVNSVLSEIVKNVAKDRMIFSQFKLGVGNALAHPRKHIIVIHPELAMLLQRLGYNRKSLREYIYEATKVPYEELNAQEIKGIEERFKIKPGGTFFNNDVIPEDQIIRIKENLRPRGKIPVVNPKDIHIIVAGTIPGYTFELSYFHTAHRTKIVSGIAD